MAEITGGGLNFTTITDSLNGGLSTFETELRVAFENKSEDMNAADLLELQTLVTEWSLFLNTHSTVVKSLGDALRGVLQKIN
jgi:type III secretion apparatus needle protein